MSTLPKALDGNGKKYLCLLVLLALGATFGIAWRLLLRPRPLRISLKEVEIYEWNATRGTFNSNPNTIVSSASKLKFRVRNPSFCWIIHVKQAQIRLLLLTPHFKFPLATGKLEQFRTEARGVDDVRSSVVGDRVPLFSNSRYMPLESSPFKLALETVFRSKPRSRWCWVPFSFSDNFFCELSCSISRPNRGQSKLEIQENRCGLDLEI